MTVEPDGAALAGILKPARDHSWYVLRTAPSCEKKVKERAAGLGIEVYFPVSVRLVPQDAAHRHSKAGVVVRPAMPGYVFVLMPHSGARFDLFATQTGRSDHRPELVADDAAIGDYVALVSRPETPPIEGSLGFVHFGERMASIPHDAIADLRFRELDGEFNEAQQEGRVYVARWIKRGAKVEIIAGPFAGMFGSVQSVINKHTVSVWAQLFGQLSKVAMPIDHIRRLR